jgi:hypothetical protein
MAGFVETTKIISPNFSLGSILIPGFLITILSEYNPGATLIIDPGFALSTASCIDLNGPNSASTIKIYFY